MKKILMWIVIATLGLVASAVVLSFVFARVFADEFVGKTAELKVRARQSEAKILLSAGFVAEKMTFAENGFYSDDPNAVFSEMLNGGESKYSFVLGVQPACNPGEKAPPIKTVLSLMRPSLGAQALAALPAIESRFAALSLPCKTVAGGFWLIAIGKTAEAGDKLDVAVMNEEQKIEFLEGESH